MKKILLLISVVISGCTTVSELKKGQAVVIENQVEGIDISIPIPFADNVNIFSFRFGFIQNKLFKGNDVKYISNSNYKDISLIKGQGSVTRELKIGK